MVLRRDNYSTAFINEDRYSGQNDKPLISNVNEKMLIDSPTDLSGRVPHPQVLKVVFPPPSNIKVVEEVLIFHVNLLFFSLDVRN